MQEFECCVCYQPMHPPIRQCESGHSYCSSCYERLDRCPLCRSQIRPSTNILLEEFHKYVIFPCKFHEQGCTTRTYGSEILAHERDCSLNLKLCPFSIYKPCTWSGPRSEILRHYQNVHRGFAFSGNTLVLIWRRFNRIAEDNSKVHFLIDAYGELFMCMFEVDMNYDTIRWAVIYLGDQHRSSQYYFELELRDVNRLNSAVVFTSSCGSIIDGNVQLNNSEAVFVYYKMAMKYCKGSNLEYQLRILLQSSVTISQD